MKRAETLKLPLHFLSSSFAREQEKRLYGVFSSLSISPAAADGTRKKMQRNKKCSAAINA